MKRGKINKPTHDIRAAVLVLNTVATGRTPSLIHPLHELIKHNIISVPQVSTFLTIIFSMPFQLTMKREPLLTIWTLVFLHLATSFTLIHSQGHAIRVGSSLLSLDSI